MVFRRRQKRDGTPDYTTTYVQKKVHLTKAKFIFASHTGLPGGGELALLRYLRRSELGQIELFTSSNGPVWDGMCQQNELRTTVLSNEGLPFVSEYIAVSRHIRRRTNGPAVVVANSMRIALILALVRKNFVLVYWVRDGLSNSSVNKWAVWITRRFTLRRVDVCVANSEWTASSVRQARPRLRVFVSPSPCGVSPGGGADPQRRGHGQTPVRIVYVGRIAKWKGVDVAINAVRILNETARSPRFTLDIVGGPVFDDDSYFDEVRTMCSGLDYVTMKGHADDVNAILPDYELFFHCSVLPEPFGQVVVQGMNAGLVVFASNHGGPAEIIENGVSGFLYEPGSSHKLAVIVTRVADQRQLVERVSAGAKARARDYSDEIVVSRLDRIFGQIRDEYGCGA